MFLPAKVQGGADASLNMSSGLMLHPVGTVFGISGFRFIIVFALVAFSFILIIKATHHFVANPVFPAKIRLNKFMDGDSELAFW
jgi:hypothetical protein